MEAGFEFIYELSPIDFSNEFVMSFEKFKNRKARKYPEFLKKAHMAIEYFLLFMREELRGDIWVFAIPNPNSTQFELALAIKADNNGTTYIFTDVNIYSNYINLYGGYYYGN